MPMQASTPGRTLLNSSGWWRLQTIMLQQYSPHFMSTRLTAVYVLLERGTEKDPSKAIFLCHRVALAQMCCECFIVKDFSVLTHHDAHAMMELAVYCRISLCRNSRPTRSESCINRLHHSPLSAKRRSSPFVSLSNAPTTTVPSGLL